MHSRDVRVSWGVSPFNARVCPSVCVVHAAIKVIGNGGRCCSAITVEIEARGAVVIVLKVIATMIRRVVVIPGRAVVIACGAVVIVTRYIRGSHAIITITTSSAVIIVVWIATSGTAGIIVRVMVRISAFEPAGMSVLL